MPEFVPDVEQPTVAEIVHACERLEWYGELCDVVYVPGSSAIEGPLIVAGRCIPLVWAPTTKVVIVGVDGSHFRLDGEAI